MSEYLHEVEPRHGDSSLKSGGDAMNIGGAGAASGNVDSAGVGAGVGALGSLGLGAGFGLGGSGNAYTGQSQSASGGNVTDNTDIGDININT